MALLSTVLTEVTYAYLALLVFRMIMSYVWMFARNYRATGFMAILLEVTYTLTDPPLRFLRRYIRPLPVGPVMLDLSFIVLFMVVFVLATSVWPHLG